MCTKLLKDLNDPDERDTLLAGYRRELAIHSSFQHPRVVQYLGANGGDATLKQHKRGGRSSVNARRASKAGRRQAGGAGGRLLPRDVVVSVGRRGGAMTGARVAALAIGRVSVSAKEGVCAEARHGPGGSIKKRGREGSKVE